MVLDGHEVREMTDTELAQHELDKVEAAARAAAQAAKVAARQAVLDKLGLTANEAAALLG
jgi:adenylylsulfate kinase-like enzyme